MKFTSDGYTEPMSPRPLGLLLGAVILLGGIAALATGWMCTGMALVVLGPLFLLNETGTRRIRVTRTKLLIEEESRVRGLLIGPRRSRMAWKETESIEQTSTSIVLKGAEKTWVLAEGAPALELSKLKARIEQAKEDA